MGKHSNEALQKKTDDMGESYKAGRKENMMYFINKSPKWNEGIYI